MTHVLDPAKIPPLPRALGELTRLLESPDSGPLEIAKQISLEPASVAKVLKMANSTYFGGRGRISTVSAAVLMLGLNTLKPIVIAVEAQAAFGAPPGLDLRAFWRRAFALGGLCQWAIRRGAKGQANYETAFTVGLLSEIGRLALEAGEEPTEEVVRRASAEIALHWRLPSEVVEAIRGTADADSPYLSALNLAEAAVVDLDAAISAIQGRADIGLRPEALASRIEEARDAIDAAVTLID
jgi:HD-like signal output (HDOD) protein